MIFQSCLAAYYHELLDECTYTIGDRQLCLAYYAQCDRFVDAKERRGCLEYLATLGQEDDAGESSEVS